MSRMRFFCLLLAAVVVGVSLNECVGNEGKAPKISDITVSGITATSASIHWVTNEPATSQAKYGLNSNCDAMSTLDSALVDTHTVNISSLEPSTTYHYKVESADAGGHVRTTVDHSFDTLAAGAGISGTTSTSQVTDSAFAYDGEIIELSGQTFSAASPPKVVLDGRGAMNLSGNVGYLGTSFYNLRGSYQAATNTLSVLDSTKITPDYVTVQAGKELGLDLVPVSLQGLVATVPKEVADQLATYISFPNCPSDLPIYPYAVFTKDGLYLALSDHFDIMPTEFTLSYEGNTYSLYFCAGEVRGTLVRTPLDSVNFGPNWTANEFGGVIIAESLRASDPVSATVAQVVGSPGDYAFKRVSVDGSYLVATAKVDYAEFKVPFGVGMLADTSADFFKEDALRLKTIDPEQRTWQLRDGQVIGTVVYPTERFLSFLDYSAPLTKEQVLAAVRPVLIVDTLVDQVVQVANISDLNPVTGNPSQYWGTVVEFDGYALGINYPLKQVASAIAKAEIPLNVNLLALVVADSPAISSQLAIIGLNSDLVDTQGEEIVGQYRFRVAVTQVPDELVSGIPYAGTAFFLLSKEDLPITVTPPELFTLTTAVTPPGAGTVALSPLGGTYPSGISVQLVAAPKPGYAFDYWSGDASGTSPATTIAMDSDKSVTAHFKSFVPTTYTLTVSIQPLGTGIVEPSGGSYLASTGVPLLATPEPGYCFGHWSGDASGTSPTITISMDSDKKITAHFRSIVLQSISVSPSSATILTSQTQQFTATGTYSDNSTADLTATADWTSSDPSVVDPVIPAGLATGLSPGTVTITAKVGKIEGTATLTVTATGPILASIAVSPSGANILAGETQQFTAIGTYSDNSTADLTATADWTSSNPSVVDPAVPAGLATGLSSGAVTITATVGTIEGTATLTVATFEELGQTYMPTLRFEDGANATYFPVDCTFDGDSDAGNNEANYNEAYNDPAEPVWVYIHGVRWEGLIYIEFWYYYVYNNYFIEHYDDWECMIVVLDSQGADVVQVRYGSHGTMRNCVPSEVEWDVTHPIAYVEEGSHAMDVDTGTFPRGNPFHTWEGVGYVANWYEFTGQYTVFGRWYSDSGSMSSMQADGYTCRNDVIEEAGDGWWPADYGVATPWSEKDIWDNPTLGIY